MTVYVLELQHDDGHWYIEGVHTTKRAAEYYGEDSGKKFTVTSHTLNGY